MRYEDNHSNEENEGTGERDDSLQALLSVQDPEPPLEVFGEREAFKSQTGSIDFRVTIANAQVRNTGQRLLLHMPSVNGAIPGVVCVAMLTTPEEPDHAQDARIPATDPGMASPEPRYLIARHWRATTRAWEWEFPRGMGESGECPEQTAVRELQEETGIIADTERVTILQTIHADTGILRDNIAVAVIELTAEDLPEADAAASGQIDWELDNLRWVSKRRMRELIAAGGIIDGITLAAFAVAAEYRS